MDLARIRGYPRPAHGPRVISGIVRRPRSSLRVVFSANEHHSSAPIASADWSEARGEEVVRPFHLTATAIRSVRKRRRRPRRPGGREPATREVADGAVEQSETAPNVFARGRRSAMPDTALPGRGRERKRGGDENPRKCEIPRYGVGDERGTVVPGTGLTSL